jgi:virginiamycin B lyase
MTGIWKETLEVVMRRLPLIATIALAAGAAWTAQAHAYLYWSGSERIGRADLDGSGADDGFITGTEDALAVAVDDRRVYWANGRLAGAIGRANLDGSGANPGFVTGTTLSVAVAVTDEHVYWVNIVDGTISRANLDGTAAIQSFIPGRGPSHALAVDDRYIYWTDYSNGTIGRANLDGSGVNHSFITGAGSPLGVAVGDHHVYWTNYSTSTIGRANLGGSGAEHSFITTAAPPWGIAVDDRHLYWANHSTNAIGRANLDGSAPDQAFITTATPPAGIAVDGGPAGTAAAGASELTFESRPLSTLGPAKALTITNAGHGNLLIDRARLTGVHEDDFLIAHDGCSRTTLAVGVACTLQVRFAPSATGPRQAALALTSNDPASPLLVALHGTGTPGLHSPAGRAGPIGGTGAPGPTGPAGAHGLAGPQGGPGQVRLKTCRIVKRKVRGRRVKRRRCTTRLISGPATFTIPSRARARITRHRRVYATGTLCRGRLVLDTRRRVDGGRYTLTLRYRRDGRAVTTRTPITVR